MISKVLIEDLEYVCDSNLIDWEQFRGKIFLVTGATGLIGSLLVRSIIFCGQVKHIPMKIICLVRDKNKANNIFKEYFNENTNFVTLEYAVCDVLDEISLENNINVDYVVHCASSVNSKYFITNPVDTIKTSVIGTNNILTLAKSKSAKKFIYISSMEVYGLPNQSVKLVKENDIGFINPLLIRSCYSEAKRMCECLTVSAASQYCLNVSIARLAQTFGAGVSYNDNRVFAQFAKSVIENKDIVLHTKGLSDGNYVYSIDAITAILLLIQKGDNCEAYNIVNEESHTTIKNMAELVASKIANGSIKVTYDIQNENYGYAPDIKMKLSNEKICSLGWLPHFDLYDSYVRMIESMKEGLS